MTIQKAFQISTGDYHRAKQDGALSIIAKSENAKNAEVIENGGEYWLIYDCECKTDKITD